MTCRTEDGVTFQHSYNAENRISTITKRDGDCQTGTIIEAWSYAYDGDGVRISTFHDNGTQTLTRYYFGGAG